MTSAMLWERPNAVHRGRFFRLARAAWALLALAALASPAVAAQPGLTAEQAAAYVNGLGEETIHILQAGAQPREARLTALRTMLAHNLDLPKISRVLLGVAWRTLTPEQQQAYQDLVSEYILGKYVLFLSGYGGETFRLNGVRQAGAQDLLVSSTILRNQEPWAQVDWRVTNDHGTPRILDVMVEKISLIQTEKGQIQSILNDRGVDGLLDILRQRAAEGK